MLKIWTLCGVYAYDVVIEVLHLKHVVIYEVQLKLTLIPLQGGPESFHQILQLPTRNWELRASGHGALLSPDYSLPDSSE